MSSEPRYFVDARAGCIAVRDSTLTDPEYPGLHEDAPGVVWYRHGTTERRTCPTCGHVTGAWTVAKEHIAEASAECDRLNREASDAD